MAAIEPHWRFLGLFGALLTIACGILSLRITGDDFMPLHLSRLSYAGVYAVSGILSAAVIAFRRGHWPGSTGEWTMRNMASLAAWHLAYHFVAAWCAGFGVGVLLSIRGYTNLLPWHAPLYFLLVAPFSLGLFILALFLVRPNQT